MECGGSTPLFVRSRKKLLFQNGFKFICHVHRIRLHPIDRPDLRIRSLALEPTGRTPQILIRHFDQSVMHRILVNIVQPGEIAPMMGQSGFEEIVPDFALRAFVNLIEPGSASGMKMAEKPGEGAGVFALFGRMPDKVIVVGKNRPGFETPRVFRGISQEPVMESFEFFRGGEEVFFLIRARRDHESA